MGRAQGQIQATASARQRAATSSNNETQLDLSHLQTELQALLPERLQITSMEEGTLRAFAARLPETEMAPVIDGDGEAVCLTVETHDRHYPNTRGDGQKKLHWTYKQESIFRTLATVCQKMGLVPYENYHPDDTYGDDPLAAIETFTERPRGKITYSLVICPLPRQ